MEGEGSQPDNQEISIKDQTREVLVVLKHDYLEFKEQKVDALLFGRRFIDSLKSFQLIGVLNRPEIQKAARSLGGLGEKQPGIFVPLLEDLKALYLESKSGDRTAHLRAPDLLELATLVGMDNEPGITGQAVKQLREYFKDARHNFAKPLDKVGRSEARAHQDKPEMGLSEKQYADLLKIYGVTRTDIAAAALHSLVFNLDYLAASIPLELEEVDTLAQKILTPTQLQEARSHILDNSLAEFKQVRESGVYKEYQGFWSIDMATYQVTNLVSVFGRDDNFRKIFIQKIIDLPPDLKLPILKKIKYEKDHNDNSYLVWMDYIQDVLEKGQEIPLELQEG